MHMVIMNNLLVLIIVNFVKNKYLLTFDLFCKIKIYSLQD